MFMKQTPTYQLVVLLLLNQACFHQVICVFIKPINTIKVEFSYSAFVIAKGKTQNQQQKDRKPQLSVQPVFGHAVYSISSAHLICFRGV